MRIMVMFDLPNVTSEDRREYTRFRKFLIKNGFMMMQESIYSKIVLNGTVQTSMMEKLRSNKPSKGSVIALTVTEKQFAKMEFILGESNSDIIDTDERFIEL